MTSHCLSSSTRAVTSDAFEIRMRSVSKRGLAFWWKTSAWFDKISLKEGTSKGGLHTVGSLSTSCDGSGWHWRISRAYGCGNDALNCEAKIRYLVVACCNSEITNKFHLPSCTSHSLENFSMTSKMQDTERLKLLKQEMEDKITGYKFKQTMSLVTL